MSNLAPGDTVLLQGTRNEMECKPAKWTVLNVTPLTNGDGVNITHYIVRNVRTKRIARLSSVHTQFGGTLTSNKGTRFTTLQKNIIIL
jgi:hypothetical protein